MTEFNFLVTDGTPVTESRVFFPEEQDFTFLSPGTSKVKKTDKIEESCKEIKKFVENPQQIHDEYEYERLGSDPGLVVIFNQQKFNDGSYKQRTGTNRDVNELILTFGRLGYNVDKEHIYTDLTKEEILNALHKLSQEDHTHRNSLIVAVLTHGDTDDKLQAKDDTLTTYEIWKPFSASNCSTLKNKPKFFIFQACKGQSFSQHDATQGQIIPRTLYSTPPEPDMLVAFAAVEGSQSYRHIFNGTWFIQEMCRNFSAFGRRDDVVSLLIRTTKCVATNYYHISQEEDSNIIKKQMPLFVSTLRKKFYLTKSKDRHLMLRLLHQQQEIKKTLEDVQQKVDVMFANFQGKRSKKKLN